MIKSAQVLTEAQSVVGPESAVCMGAGDDGSTDPIVHMYLTRSETWSAVRLVPEVEPNAVTAATVGRKNVICKQGLEDVGIHAW